MDPNEIAARLAAIRERIALAAGKTSEEIRLVAVTKAHGKDMVRAATAAGLSDFGENYIREGIAKMEAAGPGANWHFIGRVQSNKTRAAATHYDWVHTLIHERTALRLNAQRPPGLPPLSVCLQVRMQEEDTRPALSPGAVPELASLVAAQPRLRLRGLMGLPLPGAPAKAYLRLRALFDELNAAGMNLDTLSMGMTGDLEIATECGATLVRVGAGLFGPRPPR